MTQKEKDIAIWEFIKTLSCYHCCRSLGDLDIDKGRYIVSNGRIYHEKCQKNCLFPDHLILCSDTLKLGKTKKEAKAILNEFYNKIRNLSSSKNPNIRYNQKASPKPM